MVDLNLKPSLHVLLAEDDEISQQIVAMLLEGQAELDLTIVSDGRAALEAIQTKRFDLLILDQNLPHISGDRIVRHLRAGFGHNVSVPIIRYSAEYTALTERSSGLGFETLVPKPLDGALFVDVVRKLMGFDAMRAAAE